MVIRPLDDRTRYAQSVVADSQPLGLGHVGVGMGAFGSSRTGSYQLTIYTYGLPRTVFQLFSWLQKHFHPSARPTRIRSQIQLSKLPLRRAAKRPDSAKYRKSFSKDMEMEIRLIEITQVAYSVVIKQQISVSKNFSVYLLSKNETYKTAKINFDSTQH